MDWEALLVIGLFTLVLGILLIVPIMIFVKRKLRSEPSAHLIIRLTKTGWILIGVTIFVLIGGFSMQYFSPDSTFGQFVKTSAGRFVYLSIVIFIFWLIEVALKSRGIKMIDRSGDD
jgi:hypothetical protein